MSEKEWAAFTNPETFFNAANGATFASPIYWREATDLPAQEADDLFAKIQGLVEEQTEIAVPDAECLGAGLCRGGDAPPGSIAYEVTEVRAHVQVLRDDLHDQSDQADQQPRRHPVERRGALCGEPCGRATVMGALALQIGDLAMGRDPQDMTTPEFWGRAAMKGGGFGIRATSCPPVRRREAVSLSMWRSRAAGDWGRGT